jgi:recombination protein RecA
VGERVKRKKRVKKTEKKEGNYFADEQDLEFISTGCQVLDRVLGGGVAEGRVCNVVGDKSSGKTLLAIELSANFYKKHGSKGDINYHESESAFDKPYATALGMPTSVINFVGEKDPKNDNTVEYLFEKLTEKIAELKKSKKPALYIIDSLDALTDRAELARDIDEGSYGGNKPKKMSELFRRLIVEMGKVTITLVVISQVRDKIGVTFGKKKTRSGGKALDFYASQVIWLAEIKKMRKTFMKIKRVYGIQVKATCEKNKVGLPFRDCEYPVLFGYGIDDVTASLQWLEIVGGLSKLKVAKSEIKEVADEMRREMDLEFLEEINEQVDDLWREVEIGFLPEGKKY